MTNVNGRVGIYKNVAANRGAWLIVQAVDDKLGGRDAVGANISVNVGDTSVGRHLNPSYSFLCSSDSRCHFGLGEHQKYDSIHVTWPDGAEEQFPGGAVNQHVVLRKGGGDAVD